jgi:hypothetical protein
MTTFEDGPAKGRVLQLRRAPVFLRVVESPGPVGTIRWDALDQPCDTPQRDEKLHAYCVAEVPGWCHVRASGGKGGVYPFAKYRLCATQPDDAVMRDRSQWTEWCKTQLHTLPPEVRKLVKEFND